MKTQLTPVAAAVALMLATGPTWAVQDFYLAAKQYTKFLPDGTQAGFPVTMWGYVEDPGGTCYNTTPNSARQTCVDGLPDPTVPGPRLTVPVGESNVRIYLSNGLPEPTSVVIPGQELPWSSTNAAVVGPVWDDGSHGPRGANPTKRVRSFVSEAVANGGRRPYIWNNFRDTPFAGPGSFLYHSGTHPQKQVYMGLAGLLTQDAAAGQVYPGVPYNNEVTLFYSDIDPVFNEAVANGTLSTAMGRHPTWFLVNGEPYEANVTAGIQAGAVGEDVLLRMASTATDTHVVTLQGLNMTLHAEDGQQYNYQEAGCPPAGCPAPRVQYSAMLPPAKTKDAIVVAPLQGDYAVYDGNGYMTNPSDPVNEAVGDTVGGMLRFLAFAGGGTNQAPTANADTVGVVEGFSTAINVLGNDTDPEGDPLSIDSFDATGTPGVATCVTGVVAGGCNYDAAGVAAGTPVSFSYIATDGPNMSGPATVTVNVTANQVPTAGDDAANAEVGGAVVAIDVLANDNDPEGQLSLVASGPTPTTLGGSVTCAAPDCQYTPPATGPGGADSFTYDVTDGFNPNVTANVTVTVVAPNVPPTANDDPTTPGDPAFSTGINTQLTGIDVLGNDTDPDGPNPLEIASYDATGTAGGTVACNTGVAGGTCTFTPLTDYVGDDTFTYTVTDGADTSAPATVTVTVNAAAAPALYFSTTGAGSVPGVAGPYDDADVYTVDPGGIFSRLYDAFTDLGLPNNANIDGISFNGNLVYMSFAASSTNVPGIGNVPDEDVVVYNTTNGTWSPFFDGTICGLSGSGAGDIDAVSVVGNTLYFSTRGNVDVAAGPDDDADVYIWVAGGAACGRALDGSTVGLGGEDIDALTVQGGDYYLSTTSPFNPPGPVNNMPDEAVLLYSGGTWSVYRANGELSGSGSRDVDAIHVP